MKQNERGQIELKQTATRITIEGEHVCLFVLRRVNAPPAELALFDPAAQANLNEINGSSRGAYEIEILPILNAPY